MGEESGGARRKKKKKSLSDGSDTCRSEFTNEIQLLGSFSHHDTHYLYFYTFIQELLVFTQIVSGWCKPSKRGRLWLFKTKQNKKKTGQATVIVKQGIQTGEMSTARTVW